MEQPNKNLPEWIDKRGTRTPAISRKPQNQTPGVAPFEDPTKPLILQSSNMKDNSTTRSPSDALLREEGLKIKSVLSGLFHEVDDDVGDRFSMDSFERMLTNSETIKHLLSKHAINVDDLDIQATKFEEERAYGDIKSTPFIRTVLRIVVKKKNGTPVVKQEFVLDIKYL